MFQHRFLRICFLSGKEKIAHFMNLSQKLERFGRVKVHYLYNTFDVYCVYVVEKTFLFYVLVFTGRCPSFEYEK